MATPEVPLSPYRHLQEELHAATQRVRQAKRLRREAQEALENMIGEDPATIQAIAIRQMQRDEADAEIERATLEIHANQQMIDALLQERVRSMTPSMAHPRIPSPGMVEGERAPSARKTSTDGQAQQGGSWLSRFLGLSVAPKRNGPTVATLYPSTDNWYDETVQRVQVAGDVPIETHRVDCSPTQGAVKARIGCDGVTHGVPFTHRYRMDSDSVRSVQRDASSVGEPRIRGDWSIPSNQRIGTYVPEPAAPDRFEDFESRSDVSAETKVKARATMGHREERMELPELIRPENLMSYLKRLDATLSEYGYAQRIGNGFEYRYKNSTTLLNKILKSMSKCDIVHKKALQICEVSATVADWGIVKNGLIKRFGDREILRSTMENRLNALVLKSNEPAVVEDFILDVEDTIGIYGSLFPDDLECRMFKRKIIEALPSSIKSTVKLQLRLALGDRDMDTAPIDVLGAVLRAACGSLEGIHRFVKDKSNYAGDERSGKSLAANQPTLMSARDFASKYQSTFVVFPGKIVLTADNFRGVDGFQRQLNKHGPWYLVGFKEKVTAEQVKSVIAGIAPTARVSAYRERWNDAAKRTCAQRRRTSPILLDSWHMTEDEQIRIPLLIDSGAGNSYLTLPEGHRLQSQCYTGAYEATDLADGKTVQVNTYIDLQLKVATVDGKMMGPFNLNFKVLNRQAKEFQVLLGLDHMVQYKIEINTKHGLQCVWNDEMVFKASEIPIPISDSAFRVTAKEVVRQDIDTKLQVITDKSWRPIPGCPDFAVRLREMEDHESPDPNTCQTHIWEVKVPNVEYAASKLGSYETQLYQKLSEKNREAYDKLVKKYCDSKFWFLAEQREDCQQMPDAPVFLTFSGAEKKPRLVCDLREANSAFECTSHTGGVLDHIARLRIVAPEFIVCGDLEQAFYHVRLANAIVNLKLGDKRSMQSNRMCFGLTFGTAALDYIVKQLVDTMSNEKGYLSTFVDDFVVGSREDNIPACLDMLEKFVYILSRTGFCCNQQKFGVLYSEAVEKSIEQYDLPQWLKENRKTSVVIVGTTFTMSEDHLITNCVQGEFEVEGLITKKHYFKLAGQLGFDPSGLHPNRRELADALRRIIGPENITPKIPKMGWNQEIRILDEEKKKQLAELIEKIKNLESPCPEVHQVPLNRGELVSIILTTDASDQGGGYLITIVSGETEYQLLKNKWIWPQKHRHNHSNVKEMRALTKGILQLSTIISEQPHLRGRVQEIKIFSDNSSAVGWCKGTNDRKRSEVLMRRSLHQLVTTVQEEKLHLNEIARVSIEHIKGTDNVIADELSRDVVCAIRAAPRNELKTVLLQICDQSRKLCDVILYLKGLMEAWNNLRGVDAEISWEDCSIRFWKIIQAGAERPENTFYDIDDQTDLIVSTETTFDGTKTKRIFIPEDASAVSRLIIRETHIVSGHASIDNTCARIREKHVVRKLKSEVRLYIKHCIICQRASSKPGTASTELATTKNKVLSPYQEVEIDVLYVSADFKILSVTCRSTGHTTWIVLEAENSQGCLKAFYNACSIVGFPEKVHCDGASYFRSRKFRHVFPQVHIQAAYAGWEGGLHETLHRRGMEVMRNVIQQQFQRMSPKRLIDRQWILNRVNLLLNTRPLSITREYIITPDLLALGYTRALETAEYACKYGKRLKAEEIRKKFASLYVAKMREHSMGAFAKKNPRQAWKPRVGDLVLVYTPTTGKESVDWHIAKITDVMTRRATVVRKGKSSVVNINNIAPLAIEGEDE